MILHLGFVDLVDRIASSLRVQPVAILELSEPVGGAPPVFSYSSSIGFIVVKNTACLPLLRLFPPGVNPFLIIEFNSLAFPKWWMYSAKPFGNSTWSCNSESKILSPECP